MTITAAETKNGRLLGCQCSLERNREKKFKAVAMKQTEERITHSEAARNIVTNLLEAINREDFTAARTFLQDDMRYIGVFGSRDGADASLAEVQQRSLKFGIREVIAEGNEVAVFYDLSTSGVTLFAAGRFQIRDGKVILIHVVFDPRPVLETMAKK
jgi:hypothetical protein